MTRKHRRDPVDLVFHGDTGCYTMLTFEPYSAIFHSYSGMGLGGGTGAGIDPFITNKQIAFMGDSTFFHSGMIAGFTYHDVSSYKQYVIALRVPEGVTGCRHVRYPKMERARRFVEGLLKGKVPISTEDNVLNKESRVAVNLSGDLPV